MSQERFDIYFAGQLLPDHDPAAVKAWLGKQFKLQGEALDRLFSGQSVRIKQDVDLDTAGRYRAAFRQAGALLDIRPVGAAAPQPAPAGADSQEPELLPANTGSLADCAAPVADAPLPDIDHLGLAAPEQPLDDTPPAAAADIDISHLSAAPANSGDLSDCRQEKPARPLPDISALQIADD